MVVAKISVRCAVVKVSAHTIVRSFIVESVRAAASANMNDAAVGVKSVFDLLSVYI